MDTFAYCLLYVSGTMGNLNISFFIACVDATLLYVASKLSAQMMIVLLPLVLRPLMAAA